MKDVWGTGLIIVFMVLVLPGLLSLAIHKIPSGYQPSLTDAQQILPETTVSQSFTASQNGLSGVALTVRNPFDGDTQPLNMSLLQNGIEIRKVSINGANIPDGGYMDFSFSPVIDSQGQTYAAVFTTSQEKIQFPFELYHSNKPFNGVYQVNGQMNEGSLSFITYYAPKNKLQNLITIYGSWFHKFFQDLGFAVFYLLVLILGISYSVREYSKNKFK